MGNKRHGGSRSRPEARMCTQEKPVDAGGPTSTTNPVLTRQHTMRSTRGLVTAADTRPRVSPCRHQHTFSSSPSRLLHATRMLITTTWRLIPLVWNCV